MGTKPETIVVRCGANFKILVEKTAADKEESVSEYIRKAIEMRMKKEGN